MVSRRKLSSKRNYSNVKSTAKLDNVKLKLHKVKELLEYIETNQISSKDLTQIIDEDMFLPTAIFNKKLTVLESAVKYLRENKRLSLRQIAGILGRDERNVWHIYRAAKTKAPRKFSNLLKRFEVPTSIFPNTKLSAQEAIVCYLKNSNGMTFNEIAEILARSPSTIRTVYQRYRRKNAR